MLYVVRLYHDETQLMDFFFFSLILQQGYVRTKQNYWIFFFFFYLSFQPHVVACGSLFHAIIVLYSLVRAFTEHSPYRQPYLIQPVAENGMFWSLLIYRGLQTREPASIASDDEQGGFIPPLWAHTGTCFSHT